MNENTANGDRPFSGACNSIGILNVQKRIKPLCGRESGLCCAENPEGGVTAHLLLPIQEDQP